MLTPYQKWFKSWHPKSVDGRAAKRNAKVMEWPVVAPNNVMLPPMDLRPAKWTFNTAPATVDVMEAIHNV